MDREFTWNAVKPNEQLQYSEKRLGDIEAIRARIDELKAERAQLVATLGDQYSDERLGAQMLRAGDEGAMYKFLRAQKDTKDMQLAEKARAGIPTQEQFDKTYELLLANQAAQADPKLATPQAQKYGEMNDMYMGQLDDMLARNPSLNRRNYGAAQAPAVSGGDYNKLQYDLIMNSYDDDAIDAKVRAAIEANPDSAEEFRKLGEDAKKKSDTAYAEYTRAIAEKNAMMKSIYELYRDADAATKRGIAKTLGTYIDTKTGNFKPVKAKSKKDWLKGK